MNSPKMNTKFAYFKIQTRNEPRILDANYMVASRQKDVDKINKKRQMEADTIQQISKCNWRK